MHRQDAAGLPQHSPHSTRSYSRQPNPTGCPATPSPNVKIVTTPLTRFNMTLGDLVPLSASRPSWFPVRRCDIEFFLTPLWRGNRFLLPNQSESVQFRSRGLGSTSTTKLHWFSLVPNSGAAEVAQQRTTPGALSTSRMAGHGQLSPHHQDDFSGSWHLYRYS